MPSRPDAPATASLLVLESDARFPFEASCYRGTIDTAIIVQQQGEPSGHLARRIGQAARELEQSGVRLGTVAIVVDQRGAAHHPERHDTALALIGHLSGEAPLVLIADGAGPTVRHELIELVGTLIERDGVKHPLAVDFDAQHMAELRAVGAPGTGHVASADPTATYSHAC